MPKHNRRDANIIQRNNQHGQPHNELGLHVPVVEERISFFGFRHESNFIIGINATASASKAHMPTSLSLVVNLNYTGLRLYISIRD